MLTPTSLSPQGDQPESIPVLPPQLDLPSAARDVEHGVASAREQMAPFLAASREAAQELEREREEIAAARRSRPKRMQPVAAVPEIPVAAPSDFAPARAEAGPQESLVKGAAVAALGTSAVAAALPAYESAVITPTTQMLLAGSMPSMSQLGVTLGLPAVGAGAGYYLGRKLGHPVAGTVVGAGAGVTGTLASMSLPAVANSSLNAAAVSVTSAAALHSLAASAGIAAAAGGALYGLGRWHGNVWGSKPGGILKTMARGLVAPVSVPVGYLAKLRGRKA